MRLIRESPKQVSDAKAALTSLMLACEDVKRWCDACLAREGLGDMAMAENDSALSAAVKKLRDQLDQHFDDEHVLMPNAGSKPHKGKNAVELSAFGVDAIRARNLSRDLVDFTPGRASNTADANTSGSICMDAVAPIRLEPFRRDQIGLALSQSDESERARFISHYRIGADELAAFRALPQHQQRTGDVNAETLAATAKLLEPAGAK